jgi:hypothetical protein
MFQGDILEHLGQVKVLQTLDLIRDDPEGNPDLPSLLKDIDSEPAEAIDFIPHIDLPVLDESFLLPVVHETERHLRHIIRIEGFHLIPGSQRSIHPEDGRSPHLNVNVGSFLSKGF